LVLRYFFLRDSSPPPSEPSPSRASRGSGVAVCGRFLPPAAFWSLLVCVPAVLVLAGGFAVWFSVLELVLCEVEGVCAVLDCAFTSDCGVVLLVLGAVELVLGVCAFGSVLDIGVVLVVLLVLLDVLGDVVWAFMSLVEDGVVLLVLLDVAFDVASGLVGVVLDGGVVVVADCAEVWLLTGGWVLLVWSLCGMALLVEAVDDGEVALLWSGGTALDEELVVLAPGVAGDWPAVWSLCGIELVLEAAESGGWVVLGGLVDLSLCGIVLLCVQLDEIMLTSETWMVFWPPVLAVALGGFVLDVALLSPLETLPVMATVWPTWSRSLLLSPCTR
jgi:hypothetical protein